MKTQFYIKLSDRIAWNSLSLVKDILSQNKDLDLLHKNGIFFRMAIESNFSDITEVLLNYFTKNQLSNYTYSSTEYYNLKAQLIEVIEFAIDEVDLLPKMKQTLSPYINFADTNDKSEQDLLGFDLALSDISAEESISNGSNSSLSEENIILFNKEQENELSGNSFDHLS